ncbi:CHAT domain-containing protein [Variovorax sp. CF079]|uniref:CHAT domain-containing protein n=1 Tax=Variovorax sp. CF079 TaxID=1882774 RepID=UPI0008838BAF|nr:CHAT domain-containing protein [Variovorax sp. CF079]SDC27920.1 CHAT domain-containing protein [Variovorax sp. CF079]
MTTETQYENFDLRIWREGDRYLAEVSNSPAGPSDRVVLRWPFGNEPHDVLLLKLENAILRGRGSRGGLISGEEKILREFGAEVFKAVFRNSDSVAQKFMSSFDQLRQRPNTGLRLNLRVDPPELAMLPWEYVFDESTKTDSYLCLKNLSPLVRFMGNADGPGQVHIDRPLRILAMIANPGGEWEWLDTEAERRRMEEVLQDSKLPVHFRWVLGGTPDDLFDLMLQGPWHIFHFIGHGGTDRYLASEGAYRSEGFVVMQDGLGSPVKVSASELGVILGNGNVHLAVLNCCESARGNSSSSTGAALVDSGIPMAIAMQFAITNIAASRFSGMFYKSLKTGATIEKALTVARQYMRLQSSVEWGIPVFFTRAGSCVLFEPAAVGAMQTEGLVAPAAGPATASPPPLQMTKAQEKLRELWGLSS